MELITVRYRLTCPPGEATAISHEIALEQTVEVPANLITSPRIRDEVVGRVLSVEPVETPPAVANQGLQCFDAQLGYAADLAGNSIGQLLNLVYGNISMKPRVRLIDWELPPNLLRQFQGPKAGVAGFRQQMGVTGRPLLATALKPRGSTIEELALLAERFAAGGGDLVKDDHNLSDASFDDFRRRVEACQAATAAGAQQSGRRVLYFPNLSGDARDWGRRLEFLTGLGVPGVMVAPLLIGLDAVRDMAATFPLLFLAHPTFTGAFFHDPSHGADPGWLLGDLFRLAGCDGTIFPNHGGRFSFSPEDCGRIVTRARATWGDFAPVMPAPAGGMSFENIPHMAESYGTDTIFLIGGALLSDSGDLRKSTGRFLEQIEKLFPEHQYVSPVNAPQPPADEFISACELPPRVSTRSMSGSGPTGHSASGVIAAPIDTKIHPFEHLIARSDAGWEGRVPVEYKLNGSLPFAGISRTELFGANGTEQTAFDVRYFEIAPGGYSSLEKHVHTHVVIGVRGVGELQSGSTIVPLRPHDVAYVPPLETHQLRNPGDQPFGFFCIVDHLRDRPQAP